MGMKTSINISSSSILPSTKNIADNFKGARTSFSQALFYYIDARGLSDVEAYTRAHMDRKLFSKLRNIRYNPSKKTAIALALALELDYSETMHLLSLAGYTLSTSLSMPFDIIITNAIQNSIYDIDEVNERLHRYDLPLLGK